MNPFNDLRFKEMLKETRRESDRASALIHAANLDNQLRRLLLEHFVKISSEMEKQVFEGTGYLSTFSSRINASYMVGLLAQNEYHDFNIVRKIRNYFAHQEHGWSFKTDEVRKLCDSLMLIAEAKLDRPKFDFSDPRHAFEITASSLFYLILDRSRSAFSQKRVLPFPTSIFPKN